MTQIGSVGRVIVGLVAGTMVAVPMVATGSREVHPQQRPAFDGRSLYRTYCASCHGESARGDGPLASTLRIPPADLTQMTKRDRAFPRGFVARIIDGRAPVRGHGRGDMPVWGDAFTRSVDSADPESVQRKIAALVDYLETIQRK